MNVAYRNPNPGKEYSSIFGIFEGKAAARKTAAEADALVKTEQAKRDTLLLEALAATKGYDPKADAAQNELDQINAKSASDIWLYVVLAVIVVAVMVGLYFMRKR